MAIKFFSHGACLEVTGSKHFLEIDGRLLQIDCGMFQGRREETYQKNRLLPFDPAAVGAVVLTHAHFDHSGALPIMIKNGFSGNIHATSATRDVTQIILLDSAHIQQKDFEYMQEMAAKHPERGLTLYQPLYSAEEAVRAMENFVTSNYHRKFTPMPGVEAEFFDAGHILGSAMVHLTIQDRIRVGFSGDLGRNGLPIIRDPETMPAMDYLVLEGTYGNRLHKSIGLAKDELAEIINKAKARNGKIIIPAFTIERTQELIYLIHVLQKENKIPILPIFIDSPMAVNATAIFKIHPECFDEETICQFISNNIDPFGFDNIHYVVSTAESKEINSFSGPAIIISASGMAESGRILHHLSRHIENPANIVAIVGFMAEHTLGRRLVERASEIKIFGRAYKVKAEIATLNAFSAHADYAETCEWLKGHDLKRLKKVFLVHGEDEALANLQTEVLRLGIPQVEIVRYGDNFELNLIGAKRSVMETLNFNGITCQVVRRNSRRVCIAFHGGRLRVVLPLHLDPLLIINQHKKWILEKHEWFQQQRLLAGQLELSRRTNEEFLGLVRDLSRRYAGVLAVRPLGISFRKMKSKWGSCSPKGKICLNTGLQVLPAELVAFVVFHELAHLKVRNHGPGFKSLIRSEFPDFRALDKKLKLYSLKIL